MSGSAIGTQDFTIDAAGPGDLDDTARLFDAYRVFYEQPSDPAAARAFIGERLSRDDSAIFLARRIAGRAALGFTQLYPSFSSVSMRPIWILNDLYVDPAARRSQVGTALLEHARRHAIATGAKRLELTTARTNTAAQAAYRGHGWVPDEVFLKFTLTVG